MSRCVAPSFSRFLPFANFDLLYLGSQAKDNGETASGDQAGGVGSTRGVARDTGRSQGPAQA